MKKLGILFMLLGSIQGFAKTIKHPTCELHVSRYTHLDARVAKQLESNGFFINYRRETLGENDLYIEDYTHVMTMMTSGGLGTTARLESYGAVANFTLYQAHRNSNGKVRLAALWKFKKKLNSDEADKKDIHVLLANRINGRGILNRRLKCKIH